MNDLISRQQACDELEDLADFYNREVHRPEIANGILAARARLTDQQHIPTVDAVPVVRCKKCKSYCAGFCTRDIGTRTNMFRMPNDGFCSCGERKAGDPHA